MTDAQLALQIYIEDLHSCERALADRHIAQTAAQVIPRQPPADRKLSKQDKQISDDRKLAESLAGLSRTSSIPSSARSRRRVRFTDGVQEVSRSLDPGSTVVKQNSIQTSVASSPVASSKVCVACKEEKQLVVQTHCKYKHKYCRTCIVRLFEIAIHDDSLFPPRCDGTQIALDSVRPFLSLELSRRYETKLEEIKTRNRTYCHNNFCAAFIPTDLIKAGVGRCSKCGAITCARCKTRSHPNDCPTDADLQQLRRIAQRKKWQTCYSCKAYVQLDTGCNHIT